MAAAVLLSVITAMGFVFACLALRQVRPTWFSMRASVGRWVSFSVEMDRRKEVDGRRALNCIPRTERMDLRDEARRNGGRTPRS